MLQRHLVHISIACPFEAAYDFLADPLNFPAWAAADAASFHQVEGRVWAGQMEFGPRHIRFCDRNPYGVLDHAVYKDGDEPVVTPMRLIRNEAGCDLTFVFYRRPGTSDEQFASAVEWVTTDFLVLKAVLEAV